MPTYRQIQENIRQTHGVTVKTCWIAHVKEMNGYIMRKAPNRKSETERVNPCPEEMRPIIEESAQRLGGFDGLKMPQDKPS